MKRSLVAVLVMALVLIGVNASPLFAKDNSYVVQPCDDNPPEGLTESVHLSYRCIAGWVQTRYEFFRGWVDRSIDYEDRIPRETLPNPGHRDEERGFDKRQYDPRAQVTDFSTSSHSNNW